MSISAVPFFDGYLNEKNKNKNKNNSSFLNDLKGIFGDYSNYEPNQEWLKKLKERLDNENLYGYYKTRLVLGPDKFFKTIAVARGTRLGPITLTALSKGSLEILEIREESIIEIKDMDEVVRLLKVVFRLMTPVRTEYVTTEEKHKEVVKYLEGYLKENPK